MAKFDDLINTVGKFVDMQKGTWDHLEWERLVSKVQRMGYEMSGDIVYNLGTTVESLKKLYFSKTSKDEMLRIVTDVPKGIARFIEETRGMWEHADWLRLLEDMEKVGIAISEDTQRYIGDMLEASRRLYGAPHKEPVFELKPDVVKPAPIEAKRPVEVEVKEPVESVKPDSAEAKKPAAEVKKPYETEVKKYIAAEVKKSVKVAADKAEKKTVTSKAAPKSDEEPKAKRPYKKRS
ncbi:hypothetical protein [Candidatus Magnetominusculus dajiuhuensis]|uniref:hypothetical protein n=1 Tax=Candidatus Magnetominusculus dajiuhuensis TaxID=3137712 RepID=UPI001A08413C|nr:hypothetical protein [Nitrospirota bacterium]